MRIFCRPRHRGSCNRYCRGPAAAHLRQHAHSPLQRLHVAGGSEGLGRQHRFGALPLLHRLVAHAPHLHSQSCTAGAMPGGRRGGAGKPRRGLKPCAPASPRPHRLLDGGRPLRAKVVRQRGVRQRLHLSRGGAPQRLQLLPQLAAKAAQLAQGEVLEEGGSGSGRAGRQAGRKAGRRYQQAGTCVQPSGRKGECEAARLRSWHGRHRWRQRQGRAGGLGARGASPA